MANISDMTRGAKMVDHKYIYQVHRQTIIIWRSYYIHVPLCQIGIALCQEEGCSWDVPGQKLSVEGGTCIGVTFWVL